MLLDMNSNIWFSTSNFYATLDEDILTRNFFADSDKNCKIATKIQLAICTCSAQYISVKLLTR